MDSHFEDLRLSIQDINGDFFCHKCVHRKSVFISTNQNSEKASTIVKSAEPVVARSKFHLKNNKTTDNCFIQRRWYTLFYQRKKNLATKQKSGPPCYKRINANHNQAERETKENKSHSFYGITLSVSHWLRQFIKVSFRVSFYWILFYVREVGFSPFSRKASTELPTFDQVLLFLVKKNLVPKKQQNASNKLLYHLWNCCCLKVKNFRALN